MPYRRRKTDQRSHSKRGPKPRSSNTFKGEHTVHVHNLPFDVTTAELEAALLVFGPVKDCLVHILPPSFKQNVRPFTYGFANFFDDEAFERCRDSQMPIDIRGYVLKFNARNIKKGSKSMILEDEVPSPQPLRPVPVHLSVPPMETDLAPAQPQLVKPLGEPLVSEDSSMISQVLDFSPRQDFEERVLVDEPTGVNLLVESIPCAWTSHQFYQLLSSTMPDVVSVLIYMDEDEYGMRQGLVQMDSTQAAQACADRGWVKAGVRLLGCRLSEVNSIGLLRRCYYGKLSLYHPLHDAKPGDELEFEEEPISGLPTEPGRTPLANMFATFSPAETEFTPETDFSPATEFTPGLEDEFRKPLGTYNNFESFVPHTLVPMMHPGYPATGQFDSMATMVHTPMVASPMPMPMAMAMPMANMGRIVPGIVASSTLVLNNISTQGKENLFSELRKLAPARAVSVDIAKDVNSYKVFVGYGAPHDAISAFTDLQRHFSGTPVQVRFA